MLRNADIVVVSDFDDELSSHFISFACAEGFACVRSRLEDLAPALSIAMNSKETLVDFEPALLLRPVGQEMAGLDQDARFHWAEKFAAIWAAAALSPRPVINRPNELGWAARTSSSGALLELRGRGGVVAPEVIWSGRPPPDADSMLHEDLHTWTPAASLDPIGCYRSRKMPACRGWEQAIVVQSRAFRVTTVDLGSYDLEMDSVAIAERLGLTFATISWGIPVSGGPPVLAKVNAFPSFDEVKPVWDDVRRVLLDALRGT